jgi:leucyl/phenylalanyl-tRNA---protein transferase
MGGVPIEPPPTPWSLEPAPDDHPHDLWAVGADLAPATLLAAYRCGLFPMPVEELGLGWWSPLERGVIPLETRPPRTVRRAARGYRIRVDTAFAEVVAGCADPTRPGGWIDDEIVAAYGELHRLGWAHAVEAWDDDGLAGGLYGVAIGGLFAAESMFQRRSGASKAALHGLRELLCAAGDPEGRVLDVQWLTPHLALVGGTGIPRAEYRRRLAAALPLEPAFR